MKLNQVLATRDDMRGKTTAAKSQLTQIYHKKVEAFAGSHRSYTPHDDDGERLPDSQTNVAARVPEIMRQISDLFSEHWAVEHQMNVGNQSATADIVVEGQVLMANVPATQLLFLETQLKDLRTVVGAMPLLDPAEKWTWDAAAGLWRSDAVKTSRTSKVEEGIVLHAPTDKHPAQTALIKRDKVVGEYTTSKLSGAVPRREGTAMMRRIDLLARAVKTAREAANLVEIEDISVSPLTDYLFSPFAE